ncbi:unnamed protein product [Colias eurytheme]|nr:unnamed protein product [Colias eurytheme]
MIDDILQPYGIKVLRLPPYHPELNPIENVWGILKNYIASHNVDQNVREIMKLINERLSQIDEGMWGNTCRHVQKKEEEYYRHFDMESEFIINLGESLCTYSLTTNLSLPPIDGFCRVPRPLLRSAVAVVTVDIVVSCAMRYPSGNLRRIARAGKPHTIGEDLVLPSIKDAVGAMFGEKEVKEIKRILLSNNTVVRRIDKMAE